MGCDIHIAVEKKHKGKWVMVNRVSFRSPACYRNYNRFGLLAGVRTDGPEPRGIPEDASESVLMWVEEWGGDGHSHSWLTLEEAVPIFVETSEKDLEQVAWPAYNFFGVEDEETTKAQYRIVFFFDN